MSNTAQIDYASEASLHTAGVKQIFSLTGVNVNQKECYQVQIGNALHMASLAASCLLEPQEQDIVLVANLESGQYMILSVLVQQACAMSSVSLPHNSTISCKGSLTLQSDQDLNLHGGNAVQVLSEEIHAQALRSHTHIVEAKSTFNTLEICANTITSLGIKAINTFKSLTQCLGSSRRVVEGRDETQCKNSSLVAEETSTVMAKNTIHMAKETARVDANLIQLG